MLNAIPSSDSLLVLGWNSVNLQGSLRSGPASGPRSCNSVILGCEEAPLGDGYVLFVNRGELSCQFKARLREVPKILTSS